ncbi:MAG: SMI1/KNR4 family protein [Chlamydia sp. 32-24]|nr:MAG: SMI1/KNR4 family protein [Chlamydia sp. 32-24]
MHGFINDYYSEFSEKKQNGKFHKVIALHENKQISWGEIQKIAPNMVRGWFELAHLCDEDRINFLRDYWLVKLPYHPKMGEFLNRFFSSLDGIGVYLTQKSYDDPFQIQLVYSLKSGNTFFSGCAPATEEEINHLSTYFSKWILPQDYLAFLKIHGGFCKTTDSTGILKPSQVINTYKQFQAYLINEEPLIVRGRAIDPSTLIPFYESFGMPFYQCFWAEWYPELEMGNVYYSGTSKSISFVANSDEFQDSMAFPTFSDWLMFYLEEIH